jgi:hypothetical protein
MPVTSPEAIRMGMSGLRAKLGVSRALRFGGGVTKTAITSISRPRSLRKAPKVAYPALDTTGSREPFIASRMLYAA